MKLIETLQIFLDKYNAIISILFLGVILPFGIWILKKILHTIKQIRINIDDFFNKIIITNNTNRIFHIKSITIIIFDRQNKYFLEISHESFKLGIGDMKKISLEQISAYILDGKFVVDGTNFINLSHLICSNNFCFLLELMSNQKLFIPLTNNFLKNLFIKIKLMFLRKRQLLIFY
ncbi:MAG: hypothetical protein AB7E39_05295 [Endomicrobiaceae bacterium]